MPNATDFLTSNFLNARSLDPKVRIEATIVAARPHKFENSETKLVIYTDYLAKGVVLNQSRLQAMIDAFGVNYETNWVGKKVIIFQDETFYQGKPTPCVAIEPIVADRIAAQSTRPALEQGRSSRPDVRRVLDLYEDPPPPPSEAGDGPGADDIKF
jgi:hypothetical protein